VYETYLSISAGVTGRRKAFGSQLARTVLTQVAALVVTEQGTNLARAVALASVAVTAVLATSRYFCMDAPVRDVSASLSNPNTAESRGRSCSSESWVPRSWLTVSWYCFAFKR
jgi:hypothetical protein